MSGPEEILPRLEELEARIAFQDELNERLNEVVARQDREILDLRARVAELARRLSELAAADPGDAPGAGDEIPPHY